MRWDPSGSASDSSSDTVIYDLESAMDSQSVYNDIELPDIDDLRAELTPIAWQTNPPASPPDNFEVPDNYRPSTPIYSAASPAYSPRQSPIQIDSDIEHGFTPVQNSDGPITTKASDIFDLPSDDSDLEHDGEVGLISLVGDYINRGKMPIQMNGVYIFPQPTNLRALTWNGFPYEPCSNHCVMPSGTDRSFARFYLTHSLCLKHRSLLTNLGPWLYLSNQIITLPKLHKISTNSIFHNPTPSENKGRPEGKKLSGCMSIS